MMTEALASKDEPPGIFDAIDFENFGMMKSHFIFQFQWSDCILIQSSPQVVSCSICYAVNSTIAVQIQH